MLVPSFLQGMRHSCCPLVTFSEWVGVKNIEPPTLHFQMALKEPESPYAGAERHDCQNEQDSASASAKPGHESPSLSPHSMQRPQWGNKAVGSLTLEGILAEYCPAGVGYACWL